MKWTEKQKLHFTFSTLLEKAINEMLADLYHEEKYSGFVDFVWEIPTAAKPELIVNAVKLNVPKDVPSYKHFIRYKLVQGKGVTKV